MDGDDDDVIKDMPTQYLELTTSIRAEMVSHENWSPPSWLSLSREEFVSGSAITKLLNRMTKHTIAKTFNIRFGRAKKEDMIMVVLIDLHSPQRSVQNSASSNL